MTTSGVRRTVRAICPSAKWSRRPGPGRPRLTTSSRGLSSFKRSMVRRCGMSDLPASQVRLNERFDMVSEALADLEQRDQLLMFRPRRAAALLHRTGDLVDVAADRGELRDCPFEGSQLGRRQ